MMAYDDPSFEEVQDYLPPDDGVVEDPGPPDAAMAVEQRAKPGPGADRSPENNGETTLPSASATVDTAKPREPFPVGMLPAPMARMVTAVAKSTGTDPAMAGLAALVVAAGCVGNRAVVILKPGYTEPGVLWGGIVARSGQAKSPVLRAITRPLELIEDEWREKFQEEWQQYVVTAQRYEIEFSAWKSQQKKGPVTDPPLEPDVPTERRIIISDVTVEKLGCMLAANPMGLLSVRDELAGWIGEQDRYSNGTGDAAAWLSMHDAGRISVDRKTAGSVRVARAAVSLIGGIQPGILRRSFAAAERDSGLLARFLLVRPPERPSRWSDDGIDPGTASNWEALLRGLLGIQPGCDFSGKPRPLTIPMNAGAAAMYRDWFNKFSVLVNVEADDHLQSHLSKLRGMCARLALVLELTQMASTGTPTGEVSVPAMAAAIALTDWFADEARRVYADLTADDEERDRRELLALIQRQGGTITPRDLMRASRRYKSSDDAEMALRELSERGYGKLAMTPTPGRPAYVFSLATSADADRSPEIHGNSPLPSAPAPKMDTFDVSPSGTPAA